MHLRLISKSYFEHINANDNTHSPYAHFSARLRRHKLKLHSRTRFSSIKKKINSLPSTFDSFKTSYRVIVNPGCLQNWNKAAVTEIRILHSRDAIGRHWSEASKLQHLRYFIKSSKHTHVPLMFNKKNNSY